MLLGAPIASSFGEVIFWIIELVEDVALCSRVALIRRGYYPFPLVCGFALFADSVFCLTLTSVHP